VETLRKLPPPAGQDPRIDLLEARALESLGNSKESLAAAARAEARARELGMRVVEARALLRQAIAHSALGQAAESAKAAESARSLAEAAGDRDWTARLSREMAATLEKGGDLDGAQRLRTRALAAYKAIGDLSSVARVLAGGARLAQKRGDAGRPTTSTRRPWPRSARSGPSTRWRPCSTTWAASARPRAICRARRSSTRKP
jgi:tetratricopeptide (TPR) repeat protein